MKRINNVIHFSTSSTDTQEILDEASSLEFQSIALVGVDKYGTVYLSSKTEDAMKLLGALEAAKMEVYERW